MVHLRLLTPGIHCMLLNIIVMHCRYLQWMPSLKLMHKICKQLQVEKIQNEATEQVRTVVARSTHTM
jgi:hypothetical protein